MHFKKPHRYVLIALGWLCFGLGTLGMFVPLLPTTIFWILAVWLWSSGSEKLRRKILDHPRYGKVIDDFFQHGLVPRRAKIAASVSMLVSYLIVWFTAHPDVRIKIGLAILLIAIAAWIISRPETVKREPS